MIVRDGIKLKVKDKMNSTAKYKMKMIVTDWRTSTAA